MSQSEMNEATGLTLRVFSVYDSKGEAYLQPFMQKTRALAIRLFEQATIDTDHDFSLYAADYTLFELGSWNVNTGRYELLDAPINLGTAAAHKARLLADAEVPS